MYTTAHLGRITCHSRTGHYVNTVITSSIYIYLIFWWLLSLVKGEGAQSLGACSLLADSITLVTSVCSGDKKHTVIHEHTLCRTHNIKYRQQRDTSIVSVDTYNNRLQKQMACNSACLRQEYTTKTLLSSSHWSSRCCYVGRQVCRVATTRMLFTPGQPAMGLPVVLWAKPLQRQLETRDHDTQTRSLGQPSDSRSSKRTMA